MLQEAIQAWLEVAGENEDLEPEKI